MSRLETIQAMIKELKLYREYLLNIKALSSLQAEENEKKLIKK